MDCSFAPGQKRSRTPSGMYVHTRWRPGFLPAVASYYVGSIPPAETKKQCPISNLPPYCSNHSTAIVKSTHKFCARPLFSREGHCRQSNPVISCSMTREPMYKIALMINEDPDLRSLMYDAILPLMGTQFVSSTI